MTERPTKQEVARKLAPILARLIREDDKRRAEEQKQNGEAA